jgi:putative adhesin
MKDMRRIRFVAASATAWIMTIAFVLAQGDGNRVAVAFSDPSRPGTVKVDLFHGGIRVRPADSREVIVRTDDPIVTTRDGRETPVPQKPETAGLRRLTQRSGLWIEEENNMMRVSTRRFMDGKDVELQVPARTNLILSTVNGEAIVVEGIEAAIEVTSVNGEIRLTDVSGTVVANATNGNVRVTLRQVTPEKPMSFTSFHGNVDVTLPAAVKANLKLRSDQGEVYTDFDVQIQRQRTTSTSVQVPPVPPVPPTPPAPPRDGPNPRPRPIRGGRGTRVEVDTSISGTVNGGGPEFELRTFNGDVYLRKGR